MDFISDRNPHIHENLSTAILTGLAKDGGLLGPADIPTIDLAMFNSTLNYAEFANKTLSAFFVGDHLAINLPQICNQAFTFNIPTVKMNDNTFILELFHGPTLSFKDIGARFLAECLSVLSTDKKMTVMVVTSGDTGSAVACALYQKPNIDVIILFPKERISQRQQQQITCWDHNVKALEVNGSFDECQSLAKAAFADPWWQKHLHLTTANSMNIGRILPQISYYAYASFQFYQQHQQAAGFIIPSGNLGNVTAAYWAKMMGFPIREIVIATNANRVVSDYLETGKYTPRISIATLANAMDVGNPSNFVRLKQLFPKFSNFQDQVKAFSVSDAAIATTVKKLYHEYGMVVCPHTATACYVRQQLDHEPWIIVATAHPAKFDSIIEPLIGTHIPVPEALQVLMHKPTHFLPIAASLEALTGVVKQNF